MTGNKNLENELRITARKPEGGFTLVSTGVLLAAWWAYRAKNLTLLELRVWLASLELISRRCELEQHRSPRFRLAEIHSLVGSRNDVSIRRAMRRLVRMGLLIRSGKGLSIPRSVSILSSVTDSSAAIRIKGVQSTRRIVPVPRRLLRYLAQSGRSSIIATAFGHLLRCLFYRSGECVSGGRCKASWIAEVFDVDVRTVKAARKELVELGWLVTREATQCQLNRWGLPVVINLQWSHAREVSESPPPHCVKESGTPPPIENKKLSSRAKNHEPAKRGPVGVSDQNNQPKPPILRRVMAEDLIDPTRLEELYRQAIQKRLVSGTPCDRLRFFGAAERACRVGASNPCGLFISLVRRQHWDFITQHDEDRAVRALRRLDDPLGARFASDIFTVR